MDKELNNIVNFEIAREALLEYNPAICEDEIVDIWYKCSGNPWNAVPLYRILAIAAKKDVK